MQQQIDGTRASDIDDGIGARRPDALGGVRARPLSRAPTDAMPAARTPAASADLLADVAVIWSAHCRWQWWSGMAHAAT
eukprot:SAG22_NODE_1745_length_3666_cov_1.403140_2_plen_79_part_00